ncbi:MAG TPA: PD-(D/E)XK nuclease family protein [Candidatus Paceibacterota bacterium]|nr:PD-(D/E)XK nuclease family protein [Candidatus Paceibacterota bacterium]
MADSFKKGYFRRTRGLFDPASKEPFRLSRSKVDLFIECPRCFYLDQRLGIGRPKSFPFNLNNAVDTLLKKEFDTHRAAETPHPLMEQYGIKAVPFKDPRMEEWRDALKRGVSYNYRPANLILRGGIDDAWMGEDGSLIIVDYKATSKDGEVNIDAEWQHGYKRQMEIYQWLFKMNDFKVSPIGYFVYVNGKTDAAAFDAKLEFDVSVIPYEGSTDWIPATLETLAKCLRDDRIPKRKDTCEYCGYSEALLSVSAPVTSQKVQVTEEKVPTKGSKVTKKTPDIKTVDSLFE